MKIQKVLHDKRAKFSGLRDAMRALCNQFPAEYHRAHDGAATFPEEFINALTDDGWLAAMIPEELGG